MSQLRVNAITNAAGGNTATINGMTPTADSLQGFRNRLINPGMVIDQRNAGASVTLTGYCLDRWNGNTNGAGVVSAQRVTDAPVGFSNSLRLTVTTVDSSVAGDDYAQLLQIIEGFNAADLGWGTANAQPVTISFWVKASATGSYGFSLRSSNAGVSYPSNFTVNAANTWEQKIITVPGATTGTWNTDNTGWGYVTFAPYQGPTSQGTANTWASGNLRAATGITNTWPNTLSATFQVTGVQLEAGSVATPFERRPYGTELALCQRYYFAAEALIYVQQNTSGGIYAIVNYPQPMRAAPTITRTGNGSVTGGTSGTSFTPVYATYAICANAGVAAGGTFTASAEL
jgi:hypothetical protein